MFLSGLLCQNWVQFPHFHFGVGWPKMMLGPVVPPWGVHTLYPGNRQRKLRYESHFFSLFFNIFY